MDIKLTPIWREVEPILTQPHPPAYGWRLVLKAGSEEIPVQRILTMDIVNDYLNLYGEVRSVRAWIPMGVYANRVYPNRTKLKGILFRDRVFGAHNDSSHPRAVAEYDVYFKTGDDLSKTSMFNNVGDEFAADLNGMVTVDLQLVTPLMTAILSSSVGGTFRDTTVTDAVTYLMTTTFKDLKVDGQPVELGFSMIESTNPDPIPAFTVPSPTPLAHVPDYVHHKVSGLYNAGLGSFMEHGTWYIFPPYDVTRFEKATKTLTIVNVPEGKMPGVESTFRSTANQVVIIATGQTTFADVSEPLQTTAGTGLRFGNPAKLLTESAVKVEGNKAVASRADNTNEFLTVEREDGLKNITGITAGMTSNVQRELSMMAARQGQIVQVVWENSDPDLLVPGMPVRYYWVDKDGLCQIDGVLVFKHTFCNSPSPPLTHKRHLVSTTLGVFVNRNKKE